MNPLYKSFKERQDANPPPANLNEMLQNFANQFIPRGMSAEQMVRQLIRENKMTQEQFAQLSEIADRWTGRKR